jgi:hypothetical protein
MMSLWIILSILSLIGSAVSIRWINDTSCEEARQIQGQLAALPRRNRLLFWAAIVLMSPGPTPGEPVSSCRVTL